MKSSDLKGKNQFRIVAQGKDGQPLYATSVGPVASFSGNLEFAYTYDDQDSREFKLRCYRGVGSLCGLDSNSVHVEEIEPCRPS